MIVFEEKEVKKILTDELGYQEVVADLTITSLYNLHEGLQTTFDAWLKDRTEPDYRFNDLSIEQIKQKEGCDFLNALATMSTLIKRPELLEDYLLISASEFRRHCDGFENE